MARSVLKIDLDALAANWRDLAAASGNAEAGAVVKADGYGLGAAVVAARLAHEGAKRFFVAIAEEGIAEVSVHHLVSGQLLHRGRYASQVSIPLQVAQGAYLVRTTVQGNTYHNRLIVR